MGFAIVTQNMSANAGGVTFDFSSYCTGGDTIQQLVWGISQFSLQEYPTYFINGTDIELGNAVKDMTVSLTKTGGGVGSTFVTLEADVSLEPVSESPGGPNCSNFVVTALAYIGNTSSVLLDYQTGITGVSQSPLGLSGVPNVCAGILSGFSFSQSSDNSTPLGFGVSAGVVLAPGNPPTHPSALPMGSGVFHVTNNEPMTTTVDVGSIIFTAEQPDVVVGTIVDCLSFNSSASWESWESPTGHTVTSPTLPALESIAVFLQSFAVQFQISSSVEPTPPFQSAVVGASNANPTDTGFTFTSSENMYSCSIRNGDVYHYYYAESYTATYFYVGILA